VKIAINAAIIDDKPTGLGLYALNVTRELSKFLEVSVITSHDAPFEGNTNINVIKAPEIIQPGKRQLGAITRLLWLNLVLPRTLRKERFDLLINLTHHGLFFPSVPQMLSIHDLIPLRFPSQYRLQNYYYRFLLPFLIRKSFAVNTLSEFTKKDIVTTYHLDPQKILVSGNGYNPFPETREPQKSEDRSTILMVGATYRHKNFDRFFEAYSRSRILQMHRLVIAGGKEDYFKHLSGLSRELGVHEKVEFIDYAKPQQLAKLYGNAIVFVYPSLYEGFGMPPLEAMGMGTPVAASRIGAIEEVCGDAVSYFDPTSVDNIREKVEYLLSNEGLREELVRKGLEQVKKHTWKNVAQKIYDFVSGT